MKGIDGHPQFWASVSTPAIRDSGLHLMVGTSRDRLVTAANERLYEEMFTVAFVSLLLFGGVWVLAEVGVRHQVGRIATMAEKLAAGDLSVRVASPHPSGELGGLMTELNATAESLQQQHLAIDELNQKLHQSQEAEVRAKKFLDAVVENIPQPIIVKVLSYSKEGNHDWRITLVNKAHEDLTGFPRTEQIGKSARELYYGASC